ncbi:MAG TPA: DNA replication and repair protein RecF, partial [Cytophagaceae bacterium]
MNFKNYESLDLSFSPYINIFTGSNGSGKTNLLDAIYYLSLTKSAFNSNDSLNIRHEQNFFSIQGNFVKESGNNLIQCDYTGKKVLKNNKRPYDKLSDHIGEFPVVLITPYDTDLIREGSEERRRFVDTILSQINHSYLNELIHYNQALKQRNSLLKQFNEKKQIDKTLIGIYDQKLLKSGKILYNFRKEFIAEFLPLFYKHYENLSEKKENPGLEYVSQLHDTDFEAKFEKALEKDILLQRTTKGVHKDDFHFSINNHPLKSFGSQG